MKAKFLIPIVGFLLAESEFKGASNTDIALLSIYHGCFICSPLLYLFYVSA